MRGLRMMEERKCSVVGRPICGFGALLSFPPLAILCATPPFSNRRLDLRLLKDNVSTIQLASEGKPFTTCLVDLQY